MKLCFIYNLPCFEEASGFAFKCVIRFVMVIIHCAMSDAAFLVPTCRHAGLFVYGICITKELYLKVFKIRIFKYCFQEVDDIGKIMALLSAIQCHVTYYGTPCSY